MKMKPDNIKDKLISIYCMYKEIILYILFGGATTVVNLAAYFISTGQFGIRPLTSNIIAWILAVTFAYITNKIWVFQSRSIEIRLIFKEFFGFVSARVLSGAVDTFIVWLFIEVLDFNDLVIKIAAGCIVLVMNYIFSKYIVFKDSLYSETPLD